MKVEQDAEGRKRFLLGPVELSLAALIPSAMLALLISNYTGALSTIGDQGKAINTMATQMGVMQEQLRVLNIQLANVPGLSDRVTRLEAKSEQNARDIDELRTLRGMK